MDKPGQPQAFAVISYDRNEQRSFVDFVVANDDREAGERVDELRGEIATVVHYLTYEDALETCDALRRMVQQIGQESTTNRRSVDTSSLQGDL